MPGSEVENDVGETGSDCQFKTGDKCLAPWVDGQLYDGIIVFESGKHILPPYIVCPDARKTVLCPLGFRPGPK